MLGTFQRIVSKWQLPKGIFPIGNFPNVKFPKQQLPKSVQAVAIGVLGPLAYPSRSAWPPSVRRLRGPNLTIGKFPLVKLQIWEVSTWEIVAWEVAFGKMPLEST